MDFFYYLIKFTVVALQIVKEFNPSQESDAQVGTFDGYMDVLASTFFATVRTILIALKDKFYLFTLLMF